LLKDLDPPVNPSKMIDDPEDKKPKDWVGGGGGGGSSSSSRWGKCLIHTI